MLATGGAGHIGSHACNALAAAGVESVVFDLSNGHAQAVPFGPLVTGDVRDSRALADCMRRYAIGAVLHFAGLMEVGRSMVKRPEFWDVNLDGVASVLVSMRARGVRRFVILSTAAVCGPPAKGQLDEDDVTTSPFHPGAEIRSVRSEAGRPRSGPCPNAKVAKRPVADLSTAPIKAPCGQSRAAD